MVQFNLEHFYIYIFGFVELVGSIDIACMCLRASVIYGSVPTSDILQYSRILAIDIGGTVIVVRADGGSNRLDQVRLFLLLGHLSRERTARTFGSGYICSCFIGCEDYACQVCESINNRHGNGMESKEKIRRIRRYCGFVEWQASIESTLVLVLLDRDIVCYQNTMKTWYFGDPMKPSPWKQHDRTTATEHWVHGHRLMCITFCACAGHARPSTGRAARPPWRRVIACPDSRSHHHSSWCGSRTCTCTAGTVACNTQ